MSDGDDTTEYQPEVPAPATMAPDERALELARARFIEGVPMGNALPAELPPPQLSRRGQWILDGNPAELDLTGFVPTPQVGD
jgi:hypothetical protein